MNPHWLPQAVLLAVHDRQLAEHGGGVGVRDAGLFESALTRPRNQHLYGESDPAALAAAYAFGLARNHPFIDGNKRTAFVACELFLAANGYALAASDDACVEVMVGLAAGAVDEAAFADWLRGNLQRR